MNPRAAYETELVLTPVTLAEARGRDRRGTGGSRVRDGARGARTSRDAVRARRAEIGGQFRYAREIPGKEDFHDTLRYFRAALELLRVDLRLETTANAAQLTAEGFDEIVVSTGVSARVPAIPGIEHSKVIHYPELLSGAKTAGESVAVVGAGGIGFDVATYLTHGRDDDYFEEWGIDRTLSAPGGLKPARHVTGRRQVYLLQRKTGKPGATLGKTTGWIHRMSLKHRGVAMRNGVSYERIDDAGLHIRTESGAELLRVDNVIICAGQESGTRWPRSSRPGASRVHMIGGALLAAELDAERAIREGTGLAARL